MIQNLVVHTFNLNSLGRIFLFKTWWTPTFLFSTCFYSTSKSGCQRFFCHTWFFCSFGLVTQRWETLCLSLKNYPTSCQMRQFFIITRNSVTQNYPSVCLLSSFSFPVWFAEKTFGLFECSPSFSSWTRQNRNWTTGLLLTDQTGYQFSVPSM